MARHRILLGAALLTVAAAAPLNAQRVQEWQYKWYWGAKVGMIGYTLPSSGRQFVPAGGIEWLITQSRVALYLGYLQSFTTEQDVFNIANQSSPTTVTFDGYRQIQANVVAFILDGNIQPYVGGGFVLATLTSARDPNAAPNAASQNAIQDAASGGFLQLMGGAHMRFGKKGALFVQYQFTPQGRDFLLEGGAHSLEGGIRWAVLGGRESEPGVRR